MIVGGKNKETGAYVYKVYAADNTLFATVEGFDYAAVVRRANEVHREALAPIMGVEMSDEELLAGLGA